MIRAALVALVLSACATGDAPGGEETEQPPPGLPNDPSARATALMERQFEGDNNSDQPFLRDLVVTDGADGLDVRIDFDANDNLSMGFIRGGIENEMHAAYEALFTEVAGVNRVALNAYFTLIDNLGNESEEVVYPTRLNATLAGQINWENASILDWDNIWTVTTIHPEIEAAGD